MPLLLAFFLALGFLAAPADGPGDTAPEARQGTFALTNARIETVANGTIENGTLVVEGDRIVAVGPDVAIPQGAEVIDCAGQTIYPGFIDAGTRLGLVEVGSLAETRDFAEIGALTPHMKALTAVNPSSVSIPVTRVNGVTSVLTAPSGGLLPGTAALIDLFGYTPQQMDAGFEVVLLDYPATGRRSPYDDRSDEEIEKAAEEALEKLNDTWDAAELYARIDSARAMNPEDGRRPEYAPALQALTPVIRGETPLLIEVNTADDIASALTWIEERGLTENVIFSGVAEGWRVADQIAEAGLPCLVGPVFSVPTRTSDRYDKAYANPALLREAGVKIALRSGEAENARNLPYHAGFAVAYGLDRAEALRALTLAPAEIFGIAGEIGSLEEGKRANLFVASGDPFETQTEVTHLFIDGYKIPLESRQTHLYREFLNRTPGLSREEGDT